MSHKKKGSVLSECGTCGCTLLAKEEAKHRETCSGRAFDDVERLLIVPQRFVRASLQHISDISADIPENAFGWTKANLFFVHPSTLRALETPPRTPVCVTFSDGTTTTGLLWTSNLVSPLRVHCGEARGEDRVEMKVVGRARTASSLQFTLHSAQGQALHSLQSFLQSPLSLEAYLRGAFLLSSHTMRVTFCERSFSLTPIHPPLEDLVDNMSLHNIGEDSENNEQVVHVSPSCRITITAEGTSHATKEQASCLSFDDIPGLSEAKRLLRETLLSPIKAGGVPCSVIVHGIAGSGKSLLLSSLPAVIGPRASIITSIDELVEVATLVQPSFVIIVDVNILPSEKDHMLYRVLPEIISRGATVVLGVRSVDDVDLSIRVRFTLEIETGVPSETERAIILGYFEPSLTELQRETLARETHAFTGSDIASMIRIARCSPDVNLFVSLQKSRRRVRPTGLRQFALEVPTVSWGDIAGNDELKLRIQQAVIWPLSNPSSFIRMGIRPPSGVLLYGPPGCSKTLIARALAHESKMNFISVKGPELFSKWVGDSEKAVRQLFARARQVAPSIVFFDEIDAVGAARGASSGVGGGVNERVVAQLLTELDGLESNDGVVLLAATNRPDHLDAALLRPGRLDLKLYVPLPSAPTRRSLFHLMAKKIPFHSQVDIESLVERTDLYSGAEVVALCQTAALSAMRDTNNVDNVFPHHFDFSLSSIRPRTDRTMLSIYETFEKGAIE